MAWWAAPGRLIALGILIVGIGLQCLNPQSLRQLRDVGFDVEQRLSPQPAGNITVPIVAVDEDSLTKLGQWPWPRSLMAELVRRIAAGKPAALGVDVLYPEPDRFSPPRLAQTLPGLPEALAAELAQLPSSDNKLAEAFGELPTVLGEGPSEEPPREPVAPQNMTLIRQLGGDPRPYITGYASLIRSLPEISRAARAEAALTSQPDADGVVRAVPLFTSFRGQLIPTLGLQLIRIAAGINFIDVTTGKAGIAGVGLGPLMIPTDAQGRAYVHFAAPRGRYISAATVLDPSFDPAQLTGQIVLLGVTGLGLVDQKLTPMGLTQGIQVHAELIESILGEKLLHRPVAVFWIELGLIILAGLLTIAVLRGDAPKLGASIAAGLIVLLIGGEFLVFRFTGWLVDGIYPAVIAVATSAGMLLGHLRAAQAARRHLATELAHQRELTARTEGELAAARELQLGLLPHRFPAFPDRLDIDLFARIEPARAVGGDFFDFRLVDDKHLFFLIADVSGKGVPAALFMEMTLQIIRASVQQYRCDLEQVVNETNAKTAAASIDMGEVGSGMFVTAFAGIIDTDTGAVSFTSAGHDSPYIVDRAGHVRQLTTAGGPPLGVLDDYSYPIDSDRLHPGEVLMLFTDGVTEAQDAAGELYSARRLSEALEQIPADHARTVVDGCFDAVGAFVKDAEQADDITVLALRLDAEAPLAA